MRTAASARSMSAEAAAMPGVVRVLTGEELQRLAPPVAGGQLSLPAKWRTHVQHAIHNPQQPMLAVGKVRHVGEAIAVVVAESRYQALDAAELVAVDIEPLAAVVDVEAALAPESAVLHEEFATNLIGELAIEKGAVAAALAAAPQRLRRRFYTHRYAGIPIECRGVIAAHDQRTDSVTIWSATQVVHSVRRAAAGFLQLPEARVRCVALDVGGGFGTKGHIYPEDLLVPFLARLVGRPVRWIEERQEHLLCSCHSRDQLHEVEVGFDSQGHVLAFRDTFLVDCGAWNPIGVAIAYNTAVHLLGPYRIANFAATARIVATNKVPNAPYRGAGRPEAAFAMERTMDLIAQTLGLEPTEVRRRNMIHPKELPCAMGLPYRDGEPIVYDSGDFPGAMDKALQAIGGLAAFRQRQREARRLGRCLGLGVASYVEGTGVGPFESALVRIESNGSITVSSGACSQGQGMETIFAQVVADLWSVDPHDVAIALGDTSLIAIGFGTIASRSTVNLSAAIHHASERLRAKVFAIAGNMMECAPADLELRRGKVGVVGAPGMEVTPRRRGAGGPSRLGSSPSGGRRCRPRGDLLLGAADGHLVERHPSRPGRGGHRLGQHRHRPLRRGARLRRGHQSHAGRRPGRRRHGAGPGRRPVRGIGLRPAGAAADGLADGLRLATGKRRAERGTAAPGVAFAPQSARREGSRRRRRHCASRGGRQRRLRRARCFQRRDQRHAHKARAHRQRSCSSPPLGGEAR